MNNTNILIEYIPCFTNNYCYLIFDKVTHVACVIDPGQPSAVKNFIQEFEAKYDTEILLTTILNTHYHGDHAGGNLEMMQLFPSIKKVFASETEKSIIPGCTDGLKDNQTFSLSEHIKFRVFETPCHTKGSLLYLLEEENPSQEEGKLKGDLFTGDTIFIAGCGRFFEGNAAQMFKNISRIVELCDERCRIWCGHEYTHQNLRFSIRFDPSNKTMSKMLKKIEEVEESGSKAVTIPSNIQKEMKINLFFRCNELDIQKIFETEDDPISTMEKLRELKNQG